MWIWVTNLAYLAVLIGCAPWLVYRIVWQKKSRRGWSQKLWGAISLQKQGTRCVWMHAVSVGEVQLLGPLVDAIRRETPEIQVAISTSTETGFEVAQKKYGPDCVFFCPLDFSWAVNKVLDRLKPDLIVLAELELWPNLIRLATNRAIPVGIVNGRISDSSLAGYRKIQPVVKSMLRRVAWVSAQTTEYAMRFVELGAIPDRVVVSGNIKFDGAFDPRHDRLGRQLRKSFSIPDRARLFIAGSTQPDEDLIVIDAFLKVRQLVPELRLVIVPRHLQHIPELRQRLENRRLKYVLRSGISLDSICGESGDPIIVVDVMGELAGWWTLAHIAYVGGSMGKRGGQNMIEPAASKAAIAFGPNTHNFKDIVALLLANSAACVVNDSSELEAFLKRAVLDDDWRISMGQQAEKVARSHQGATSQMQQLVLRSLRIPPAGSARNANKVA